MKNNELYKQLEVIVANYTAGQVENATIKQVCNLLGISTKVMSGTFFTNMKKCLLDYIQERDDEADLQRLRSQVINWLNNNFPDWQADRGRERDKPFVKIWFNGRPE